MDVGVDELRAQLSEYLDRASRGEIIRVTDRGVPQALLVGLPASDRVEAGVCEGWIRPPAVRTRSTVEPAPAANGPTTTEILASDRGD